MGYLAISRYVGQRVFVGGTSLKLESYDEHGAVVVFDTPDGQRAVTQVSFAQPFALAGGTLVLKRGWGIASKQVKFLFTLPREVNIVREELLK